MAGIELRNVGKSFEGGVHAVKDLSLSVEDGELLVLLGPSGCGKSTVLRLVAGLEALTSGEILAGGRRIDALPPQDRDIAMVFQSYALYGHMTVRQNLEFPLRMRGVSKEERTRRAAEVARLLELSTILDSKPSALSGGQQQRVAMGRALIREPRAFLLDEPLSNLDARLRSHVRTHIARLQARLGVTTLYVTHDQVEALSLGHRVAVLRRGRLQQIGPGQALYDDPANIFVAQFLGQPGMNLMAGRVASTSDGWAAELGNDLRIDLAGHAPRAGHPTGLSPGDEVTVGIRPEQLRITLDGSDPDGPSTGGQASGIVGTVRSVETLGSERLVHVECDVRTIDATVESQDGATSSEGESPPVTVRTDTAEPAPETGRHVTIRPASTHALRLFTPDGEALHTGSS